MGLVTGGIFIVLGVFVLCVATFGIFRFEEECGVSEYEGG